jgi:hypothetical protein
MRNLGGSIFFDWVDALKKRSISLLFPPVAHSRPGFSADPGRFFGRLP